MIDHRPLDEFRDSQRSLLEFDNQLWPIVSVVLATAAVAVALVVMRGELPDPRTLDWLSLDAYTTAWGALGVIAVLLGVALAAVVWLQRIVARRILFCVLLGLLVHVVLGIYLHHQFLAILIERQLARDDNPGAQPVEQAVPDYYWQTLDEPQTRQDFEKPLSTDKAKMVERMEVERKQRTDAPELEPERHEAQFDRAPTKVEAAMIDRTQVEPDETPKAIHAPRSISPETPRVDVAEPSVEMPAPAPREQLASTRVMPSEITMSRPREPRAPLGRLPQGDSAARARPLTRDIAIPAVEPPRPAPPTPQLQASTVPDAVKSLRINRSLPSTRPMASFVPPTVAAPQIASPETADETQADATPARPFEMADVGPIGRRRGPYADLASLHAGARSPASSSAETSPSAAAFAQEAAPLAIPARRRGEEDAGSLLPSATGSLAGSAVPRASRSIGLPGRLAQTAGAGDVDVGSDDAADNSGVGRTGTPDGAEGGGQEADLAALRGLGPSAIDRRESTFDGAFSSGKGIDPGASGAGQAEDFTKNPAGGRPNVALGALASRTGGGAGSPDLDGLSLATHVPRTISPGLGRAPLSPRIADSPGDIYWHRQPQFRKDVAPQQGGTPETEAAVERALTYFARQQLSDGRWALDRFPDASGSEYADASPGEMNADTAATGLALMAFLGAGYTHEDGQYRTVVRRGLDWLVANQGADGRLYSDASDRTVFARSYGHGIAAIALCEAYGMTRDAALRGPAVRAVEFIVGSQHPELGGWRYTPGLESDTSVSGWQLMALTSARLAGIAVPRKTLDGVAHWLDMAQFYEGALYAYNPFALDDDAQRHGRRPNLPMTAEGLLMRLYLGSKRNQPIIIRGADYLGRNLPSNGSPRAPTRDLYYWYLATQVMFQMQGDHWTAWNARMRPTILAGQQTQGELAGSWDPRRPVPDRWAREAGRHYVTAMHCLMLEVYYRYLPIYDILDD